MLYNIFPAGKRLFAILINESLYDITYSGYKKEYITEGSTKEGFGIHWFDLIDDQSGWAIELQDARYGYMSFLRGSASKAIFSTGNRFIHVP